MALERKEGVGVKSTGLPNYSSQEKNEFRIPHIRKRIPKNGENLWQTLVKVHCAMW